MEVLSGYLWANSPADILLPKEPYLEPGDALVLQVTLGDNPRIVSVEKVRPALD